MTLAAAVLLSLGSALPARAAPSGEITGRLAGIPKGASFASVEAVDFNGRVRATASVSRTGDYRLALPPGLYLVVGYATGTSGVLLTTQTPPVNVRPGRRVRIRTRLHRHRRAQRRPHRKPGARAAALVPPVPKGGGITTGVIRVTQDDGPTLNYDGFPSASLINGCNVYDTSPEFLAARQQEQNLQNAGRISPESRHTFRPLPRVLLQVQGSGTIVHVAVQGDVPAHTETFFEYVLIRPFTTSSALIRESAEVDTGPDDFAGGLHTAMEQAGAKMAAAACGAPSP